MDDNAAGCNILIFVELDGSEEVFLFGEENVEMEFNLPIEGNRF